MADTSTTQPYQVLIDASDDHVALLDRDGCIVAVNDAWRRFADKNLLKLRNAGVGLDYVGVCEAVDEEPDQSLSRQAAAGIRAVIDRRSDRFEIEYPCHAPGIKRWFRMTVAPLGDGLDASVVVRHEDISEVMAAPPPTTEFDLAKQIEHEIIGQLGRSASPEQVVESLGNIFSPHIPFDRFSLGMLNFNLWYRYEGGTVSSIRFDHSPPNEDASASCWVMHHGRPLVRPDIREDLRYRYDPELIEEGWRSDLIVPILDDGAVTATFNFTSREAGRYAPSHLRIAETAADSVSAAVNQLQMHVERETIRRVSESVQRSTDLKQILELILGHIQTLGYDRVRVYLNEPSQDALVGAVQVGSDPFPDFEGLTLPLSEDRHSEITFSSERAHIYKPERGCWNAVWEDRYESRDYEWAELGLFAWDEGKRDVFGKLSIDNATSRRPLKENRVQELMTYASFAAIAIRNACHIERREQAIEKGTRELREANRRLQEQKETLVSMQRMARGILQSEQEDEILARLADEVVQGNYLRSLMVARVDRERQVVDVVAGVTRVEGRDGSVRTEASTCKRLRQPISYPLASDNVTAEVARTGRSVTINGWDRRFDQRFDPSEVVRDKVSFFLPVMDGDESVAVLATACQPEDQETVQARITGMSPLLDQVAVAIRQSRLIKDLDLARGALEDRVSERTRELEEAVKQLRVEIKERTRAEAALKASDERYHAAVEAGSIGVWDWDLDADRIHVDSKLKSLLGYSDEDLPSEIERGWSYIHPEDRRKVHAAAVTTLHAGAPFELEHRVVHRDGSAIWFLARGQVQRDPSGRATRVFGTVVDITAIKQLQDRISRQSLGVQQLYEIVSGRDLEVDDQIHEMLGVGCERLGMEVARVVVREGADFRMRWGWETGGRGATGPSRARRSGLISRTFASEDLIVLDAETEGEVLYCPFNPEVPLERYVGLPILRSSSAIEVILCFGTTAKPDSVDPEDPDFVRLIGQFVGTAILRERDNSAIQVYQERLHTLASQNIESEEQERQRIAADMHDEISQPLAVVRMELGAMLHGQAALNRMSHVRELVDAAIRKVRTLTFEISPPILHELGLCEAIEWLCDRIREEAQISVMCRLPQLPREPGRMERVIVFQGIRELLRNAVKHASPSELWVAVTQSEGWLQVRVEDDGQGFSENNGDSRLPDSSGGYGLFSLRVRLETVGGGLSLEPRVAARGTAATIRIPIEERDD